MDEFLARLRAAVRRAAAASETDEPVIETSSFTVDLAAKKVTKNGSEVHLTPTEWGMLEMLVRNRGKLVGREELLKEVLLFLTDMQELSFITGLIVGMLVIQIFFHRFDRQLPVDKTPETPAAPIKVMSYAIQANPRSRGARYS